ncbi:MAG: hypothetical protein KAJ18_08650 [Candidatus Omnitrophica bacterium]|nr:hypothetical protein [Candidatus Omnitrophota bacterium]
MEITEWMAYYSIQKPNETEVSSKQKTSTEQVFRAMFGNKIVKKGK